MVKASTDSWEPRIPRVGEMWSNGIERFLVLDFQFGTFNTRIKCLMDDGTIEEATWANLGWFLGEISKWTIITEYSDNP